MKKNKRSLIQVLSSFLTNPFLGNFSKGTIVKGNTKKICVPGLNCYSCPGALGACPIGSIQAVVSGNKFNFTYYIFGMLALFGVLFGRLICGFLCPFGFIQDLLYKLPTRKIKIKDNIDKVLRKLKYVILLLMVVILPIILTNEFGVSSPFFCKYICPAGTLEAGIPLMIKNESLRLVVGKLFSLKMGILIVTIILSIITYRPFCKYLCPLGAIYSIFNRFSFYQMKLDKDKCNDCGACDKICKMGVKPREDINSLECIRCGDCKNICGKNAITSGLKL